MPNSIEITIGSQNFLLRGDETEEHLRDVAELVKRKVDSLRKQAPTLSLQKASMLAAFDLASLAIKGRTRALDYRAEIVSRATQLLERVEDELEKGPKGDFSVTVQPRKNVVSSRIGDGLNQKGNL